VTPGTPARIVLGAACLVGLIAAVAVLTGAVRVGGDGPTAVPPPAAAAIAPAVVTPAPDGSGTPATVLAVADPVTMDVRLEDGRTLRVRALGVRPPDACYSDQALQFARRTLAGQAVTLAGDGRSDRFSRALAWVSLSQGDDYAVLAAEAGVVSSYAADAPPERMPAVRAAAGRAEAARRGLWGPPCVGGSASAAEAVSGTPG
jgi:endonuclease YncB( thermonuclease family)